MKNNIKTIVLTFLVINLITPNLIAKPSPESKRVYVSSKSFTNKELNSIFQQSYIKGSHAKSEEQFGRTVAISGNTMVIGTSLDNSNAIGINGEDDDNAFPVTNSGAAYVYLRVNNEWILQAYIKPPEKISNLGFGRKVVISGDTIVIGISSFTNGPEERIYVYQRTNDLWVLQSILFYSSFNGNELFGSSLSISSDTILVGVGLASPNGDFEGSAIVYRRIGDEWNREAFLKASNPGFLDLFGWSVAVENDIAVIGAYNEDSNATGINGDGEDNSTNNSGAAYVFKRVGTEWVQEAYLKSSQSKSEDKFGWSVAISGETIVIGAKGSNFNNEEFFKGSTYVFVKEQNEWVEEAILLPDETEIDDQFGYSVAISGDNIIIGAYYEDSSSVGINGDSLNNSSLRSGAAYLYNRVSGIWNQQYYLKASNTDANDNFGHSVAISGDTYVVGLSS